MGRSFTTTFRGAIWPCEDFRKISTALLSSIVNIDRATLIAVLTSEAEELQRRVESNRGRTASQRTRQREATQNLLRIQRFLAFLKDGSFSEAMAESDRTLCKSLERKFIGAERG
jgi:acetyl-CoA carboxylase carboxyltransferase component